jgi:hypothetical protein
MKIIFINLLLFVALNVSAQNDHTLNPAPKHKIWVSTTQGDIIKGTLVDVSDSSVKIFPGKFSEWNNHSKISVINESYSNISNIKTQKKGGLIRGMLIGTAIGISPVLVGSLFGPSIGEGGAYVSIVAFPVGIITGAILGCTSKKKFLINEEASRFDSFRKRIQY